MAELRPPISTDEFLTQVKRQMKESNFRLVYLNDEEIKAVGGIRVSEWLSGGKYLEIEDLAAKRGERSKVGFTLYEQSLRNSILIPRYYDPDTVNELKQLEGTGRFEMRAIGDLARENLLSIKGAGTTVSSQEYNIYEEIPFLRTSDVGAWETRNYAVQNVSELTYLKYKESQDLKEGDILFVKDGTYRIGETFLLTKYDLKMLVQSHFLKIRSLDKEKLNPYLLLYLLHIPIVRKQIDEKTFVQATLSTIGNRLNEIIIPIPKDPEIKERITARIQERIESRAKARNEMKVLFENNGDF